MRCNRIQPEFSSQRSDRPAHWMCHLWDIKLHRKDKKDGEKMVISELCSGTWSQAQMKTKNENARKLGKASSKKTELLLLAF